jgi:carbon-monoxide dehydrogenase large subunit
VHGDTGRVPFGMGTYGSRSLSVGGTAIMKALDKIEAKAKKIAAHLMEASDADIEFSGGEFKVKGTDKKIPFAQVALTAYVPHNYPLDKLEPGLNETAFYDPTNFTYPAGTYICEVEVDPATGVVRVDRFTAVDDFGNIINPMIVEARCTAAGAGHGPGAAGARRLRPGQRPAADRQLHGLRHAARDDFPMFKLGHVCTPCTHNPSAARAAARRAPSARRRRSSTPCSTRWRRWASRSSTCPPRRTACGKPSNPPRPERSSSCTHSPMSAPPPPPTRPGWPRPAASCWPAARPCWPR